MKLDLHIHAKERSGCSGAGEEEMIQAAIRFGLDGLAFTDHGRLVPIERLDELNRRYAPFRVFGGIEVFTSEGEDTLVYGVRDPALERGDWSYASLWEFAKSRGGFVAIAHPLRYRDHLRVDVAKCPPDAIELHSINIGRCDEEHIRRLAEQIGCKLLCNSDAHSIDCVGMYHMQFDRSVQTEAELLECLRAGVFAGCAAVERVETFNDNVRRRELVIRGMIAEGQDRKFYRETTGEWDGFFDRVAIGKSYEI